MIPNIFTWATKELSQDAFLCWLAECAKTETKTYNESLHSAAINFIGHCFKLHGLSLESNQFFDIEVRKQYYNIDVLVIVNEKYAIIIEDKLNTSQHSEQLTRYKKLLMEENFNILIPIYYKPFEQSDMNIVKKSGYKHFTRESMIEILDTNINSDLTKMYLSRLKEINDSVFSYKELKKDEWDNNSWIGFFSMLSNEVTDAGWSYVNNPSGGFMGFWWHWYDDANCSQYLQLEESKLCFKIWVEDDKRRSELRQFWCNKIIAYTKDSEIKIRKPDRFGTGQYMTVAIYDQDFRVFRNDKIDYEETLKKVKYAMNVLDNVCG